MRFFTLPSELNDDDTARFIERGLLTKEEFGETTRMFFGSGKANQYVALSLIRSVDHLDIVLGEEFQPGERIYQYEFGDIVDRKRFGVVLEVIRYEGTRTSYLVRPDKPDIPRRWWRSGRKPRVWDGDGVAPADIYERQTT